MASTFSILKLKLGLAYLVFVTPSILKYWTFWT
jgi:hypothetical protein